MTRRLPLSRPRPRLIAAALWLALVPSLLSALLPLGLPKTQHVGSAFNPATTVVAVRSASVQPRAVTRLRADDREADQAAGVQATIPVAPEPVATTAAAASPRPPSAAPAAKPARALLPWARGPPTA